MRRLTLSRTPPGPRRDHTTARPRTAAALSLALVAALTGCSVRSFALNAGYSGPRALPAALAAPFAYVPGPAAVTLETLDTDERRDRLQGRYAAPAVDDPSATAEVVFELYLSRSGAARGPRPVVVLMPILGGSYGVVKLLAEEVTAAGWHAFFCHREDDLLEPSNEPEAFDAILRRSLVNVRRTLDWVTARPEVDGRRVGLVGVSLGATIGTVLAAVDPRIGPAIIVMGGGDLPTMIARSHEQPVRRYKLAHMDRIRAETDEALIADLRARIRIDPLLYAPYVDARDVLQLVTTLDNRVPTENQWRLWRALGRPRGHAVPSGHYTLALYKGFALDALRSWFSERLTRS